MKKKIDHVKALGDAWNRMVGMLFRPFDLGKWFALGFIVWIACIGEGGGGGSFNFNLPMGFGDESSDSDKSASAKADMADAIRQIPAKLSNLNTETTTTIIWVCVAMAIGLAIALAVMLVIYWLKARFAFIFLESALKDQTLVTEPWHRLKTLGNSLFLWWLGVGAISFILIILTLGAFGGSIFLCFKYKEHIALGITAATITALALMFETLAMILFSFFQKHFVTQIMYYENKTPLAAWKNFLPLLNENKLSFLVYALIVLALSMGLGVAIVALCLLTCCIGLLLLSIPYIGTVILLPTYLYFRLYGIEFLSQFERLSPSPPHR